MVCVQNRTNRTVIHNHMHMLMHCVTQSTTTERERVRERTHVHFNDDIRDARAPYKTHEVFI